MENQEEPPISPFLADLRRNPPKAQKPVTINKGATHQLGADAQHAQKKNEFPIKPMKYDYLDTASLVAAALSPAPPGKVELTKHSFDNRRRPTNTPKAYKLGQIDMAPGRDVRLNDFEDGEASDGRGKRPGRARKTDDSIPSLDTSSTPITKPVQEKTSQMWRKRSSRSTQPKKQEVAGPHPHPSTYRRCVNMEEPPLKKNGQINWFGRPLPHYLSNAADCDKMLIGWHAAGMSFHKFPGDAEGIKDEWDRLTGQTEASELDLCGRHADVQMAIAENGDYVSVNTLTDLQC
jgi:hypothetical protein